MSVRAVVRGQEDVEKVEFWLEQEGNQIHLRADGWFVLTIQPSEDGLLEVARHSDVPEDLFEVDDNLCIRDVEA